MNIQSLFEDSFWILYWDLIVLVLKENLCLLGLCAIYLTFFYGIAKIP